MEVIEMTFPSPWLCIRCLLVTLYRKAPRQRWGHDFIELLFAEIKKRNLLNQGMHPKRIK